MQIWIATIIDPDLGPGDVAVSVHRTEAQARAWYEKEAREAADAHAHHVQGRLAGLTARLTAAAACPYTLAPHSRFLIARPQALPRALVVSACSGHGFKFSCLIGRVLADLATLGETSIDIGPWKLV